MESIKTLMISAAVCVAMALPVPGTASNNSKYKIPIVEPLAILLKTADCRYDPQKNRVRQCQIAKDINAIIVKKDTSSASLGKAIKKVGSSEYTTKKTQFAEGIMLLMLVEGCTWKIKNNTASDCSIAKEINAIIKTEGTTSRIMMSQFVDFCMDFTAPKSDQLLRNFCKKSQ